MNLQRQFPAKVILFGEYSVLLGSDALGIPVRDFSGCLRVGHNEKQAQQALKSNHELQRFHEYLSVDVDGSKMIDLNAFEYDILKKLWFDSTIPGSYGLGSSGALTAAVFERYGNTTQKKTVQAPEWLAFLRDTFIWMESYFHGSSSGFDPMISYLDHPVLKRHDQIPAAILFPKPGTDRPFEVRLFDTGRVSQTGPMVRWFLGIFGNDGTLKATGMEFTRIVNKCINDFLSLNNDEFWIALHDLSRWQLENLRPLIPEDILPLWKDGLEGRDYFMKLCGSGGGGFVLLFSKNKNAPSGALLKLRI